MKNPVDEAIEEVRALRDRVSARFGDDIHRYAEYLRDLETKLPNPLITDEEDAGRSRVTTKKPAA